MFAPRSAINHRTQSRKDDLEALLYVIFYLWNQESLPWLENLSPSVGDISKHVFKTRHYNYVEYCKQVKAGLPINLQKAYKYIMNLDFEEKPDYTYLQELMQASLMEMNHPMFQEEGSHDYNGEEQIKSNNITS